MTPAVKALDASGLSYRLLAYDADAMSQREIGVAAASALNLPAPLVFKTLVAELTGGELVVAIIPVARKLNLKSLARACGAKSATLAEPKRAEQATGYITGGISPLGQKRRHRTFLAEEANELDLLYVSAGRRGLELALSPEVLIEATQAYVCALAQ
jgi:Cys-tRNA(Pro)/Cys-tRNA(Cys) deacylase